MPIDTLEPEILGLLATIGIEHGKPFSPDTRVKKILTDAANVGAVTARALSARPRDPRFYLYPGERKWTNPFIQGRHDFLLDGVRLIDSRIYRHFYATGITPAVAIRNVGFDVYFGPAAPAGKEKNWLQTVPNKGYNVILRLYGPLQSFYDQTWKPGDFELVK